MKIKAFHKNRSKIIVLQDVKIQTQEITIKIYLGEVILSHLVGRKKQKTQWFYKDTSTIQNNGGCPEKRRNPLK